MDTTDMECIILLSSGSGCATDQVFYSLDDRGIEFDLIPQCAAHGMPLMVYSPIGKGRLLHHYTLAEIARRHDVSPAQIALSWMMYQPGIIVTPRAGSVTHVEDSFRSLSIHPIEEDLHDLGTASPTPTQKISLAGW